MKIKISFLYVTTLLFSMQNIAVADVVHNPDDSLISHIEKKNNDKKPSSEEKKDNTPDYKKPAQDLKITFGLSSDIQYGSVSNNTKDGFSYSGYDNSTTANKLRSGGLVTNNKIIFQALGISENNWSYGAYLKLNADTSRPMETDNNQVVKNPVGDKVMLFAESAYGRIEAGSYQGSADRIKVSATSIGRATGGINGDWGDWIAQKGYYLDTKNNNSKVAIDKVFMDSTSLPVERNHTRSNKVTYYSPTWNGLTFGISYIPDSEYTGTVSQISNGVPNDENGRGYGNVIEAGLRYETKIGDVGFTSSFMTEFGNAKSAKYASNSLTANLTTTPPTNPPVAVTKRDLSAWELGGQIDYKGFSIAASYGNLGKSGTTKNPAPLVANPAYVYGSDFWTAGIAYEYEKFGISLTYLQSRGAGHVINGLLDYAQYTTSYNKTSVVSLSADYSLLPGFMPYIEVTGFNYTPSASSGVTAKGNSGTVFLVGAKLKF